MYIVYILVKILLFIFGELTYNGLRPIPQLVGQERIRSIGYFLSVVMSFDFYLVHLHCFFGSGKEGDLACKNLQALILYKHCGKVGDLVKKVKVAHTRLLNLGFWS